MFFVPGRNCSKVFDFAEEPFDKVPIPVEKFDERKHADADADEARHRFDVGPCTLLSQPLTQSVAIIGPVSKQDLAIANVTKHVGSATPVMRLTFGKFQKHGHAIRVHKGVDLGG